jgi:hypothetical protein
LLESRAIWAPRPGDRGCEGLAWPPRDGAEFELLADAVVTSDRIVALLG